MPFLLYSQR
uniref:Hypothetical UbiE2 upstream protein n=1 Tax=Mus musculus TaxID=10090 RepID=Q4W8Q9_MOUSE|nr:hypothetical UbiE2 upstream protein [Mus musculus]